jgi:UDP-N-acetyl-D-glucosamine dehydrogenase
MIRERLSEQTMTQNQAALITAIQNRTATVGIIGMGYIGLPLMLAATAKRFRVLGFDIDAPKVEGLNQGRSPLRHIPEADILAARTANLFAATGDFGRLGEADIIVICVPTPLGKDREPDLSFVTNTANSIARRLRAGQLVILESTTYPGTTAEVVGPILAATGLEPGADFFLAYSPEREDPGNTQYSTARIPKVIGADDPAALAAARAFYGAFVERVVPVSSAKTAEAVKLTENVFRAVNIALVNELKVIYAKMGIDIFEVIAAAKTKPFGYMPFYPGPGLGGHCVPIDPFYLSWRARQFGIGTRFVELAGEINADMPKYVVDRVAAVLQSERGRELAGAKILIVGVAYKRDVADIRESPALVIIELMQQRGATVDYYDPLVDTIPKTRNHSGLAGMASIAWDEAAIARYDAVVIIVDHTAIDWVALAKAAHLIVDTRNVLARLPGAVHKVFPA